MSVQLMGLNEINGSLVALDNVKNVSNEEMVEIELENGSVRNGRVVQIEGRRAIIQVFEGTIIAKKGSGVSETFTVRRVSYGVGVERVFPVHSPNVAKVELVRSGKVRRSKLYYLRDRVGKAAKVKEQLR